MSTRRQPAPRRRYARAPAKPRYAPPAPRPARHQSTVRRATVAKPPGLIAAGGSALGELAGGLVPIPGAARIGSFLGGKLGHLVEKITGFGDYHVDQNSIMKGGMTPPQIVNSVDTGSVIIRHREYIGDITSSTAFAVQTYPINPGLSRTFPWLSQIATSFEQYRLRGVLFEYASTSSDALLSSATSTALGSVSMQTDYDVADDPPTSKRQMLNSMFGSSDKPSLSFIHPIECKKGISAQSILYTRSAAIPSGYDLRLYDFGNFHIATEGMQVAGGVLGELWITYEIEFFKQQTTYNALADHYISTAITSARPLGTVSGSNLGRGATIGGAISGDGRSYSFPPSYSDGTYLISYTSVAEGTTASVSPPTFTVANCTVANWYQNGVDDRIYAPSPPATSYSNVTMCVVRITGPNASITYNTDGVPPASSVADLYVVRFPDSLRPQ